MSEALEMANVKRVKALGELAHLRGCSIQEIMDTLDIRPKADTDGCKTAMGRATIERLHLNRPGVVNLRQMLRQFDQHPP